MLCSGKKEEVVTVCRQAVLSVTVVVFRYKEEEEEEGCVKWQAVVFR